MIELLDFWLLAGLLLLATLLFLWWPVLMRRRHIRAVSRQDLNVQAFESQVLDLQVDLEAGRIEVSQFEALKAELERNLLGDVAQAEKREPGHDSRKGFGVTAVVLSIAVLFSGLGLYLNLGSSGTLQQMAEQQTLVQKLSTLPPEQSLALLEQEAADNPERSDVWYALANFYYQQGRLADTRRAYDRLLELVGEEPSLLAEYAQSLFFLNNNRVDDIGRQVIERTLKVDPRNVRALGLLGIDAFEHELYAQAVTAWQMALDLAPNAPGAESLRQGIVRARELQGEQPEATAGARLKLMVSLDEKLASQVEPENTVFVLARAVNGQPMPLAVQRLQVKDLPTQVVLSDAMAMTPEFTLSSAGQVELLARVSISGQPQAQPGDLQGRLQPVNVSSQEASIELVIDQVIE
ncbi:MAG: c-type cytochrome biogenesis protein CcmI [Pseudomonadales bacterium]